MTAQPVHAVGMISGIMLSVASAVGAIAIADTQQAQVDMRFDLQRSSVVVIQSEGAPTTGFDTRRVARVPSDVEAVATLGELSVWVREASVSRSWRVKTELAPVFAADADGLAAAGVRVARGGSTSLMSALRKTPVVWLGEDLADELSVGPAGYAALQDSQLVLDGVAFSVAGVLKAPPGFDYLATAVVMTRRAAMASLAPRDSSIRLVAKVRPGSASAVGRYLLSAADPRGRMSLRDVTPPDGKHLLGTVSGDLKRVGVALALIVGTVGMLGIVNTLTLAVHRRTRELGVRSAMGWTRRRIGLLIVCEALVAGAVAGVLGVTLGTGAAALWSWSHGWSLVLSRTMLLLSWAIAVGAGSVASLIPAFRAATTSPLSAMRS